jgi:hypothetical protein
MPASRAIVPGEEYTANDINDLRSDVLNGHTHNGAEGAKIPFSNLSVFGADGSVAPSGGGKSYNEIASHVASSQGQHGLNALAHVIGGAVSGLLVQTGRIPCAMGPTGNPGGDHRAGYVTFADTGVAFSGTPVVLLQQASGQGYSMATAYNVTATGFNWRGDIGSLATMFHIDWLAIGPKAP